MESPAPVVRFPDGAAVELAALRLCTSCRFYIEDASEHADKCGHPSAFKADYVRGNHFRFRCCSQRTSASDSDCGPDARFFVEAAE